MCHLARDVDDKGGCTGTRTGKHGKSLYLPLNFAVSLKLLYFKREKKTRIHKIKPQIPNPRLWDIRGMAQDLINHVRVTPLTRCKPTF